MFNKTFHNTNVWIYSFSKPIYIEAYVGVEFVIIDFSILKICSICNNYNSLTIPYKICNIHEGKKIIVSYLLYVGVRYQYIQFMLLMSKI